MTKTTGFHSAIYAGTVWHRRFHPIKHHFAYTLYMMFLDLDELDTLFSPFWLWSSQQKNLAYFRRKDHLGNANTPLKESVIHLVKERIGYEVQGPIRLLTHLRYAGYCFNPVSFYYCYDNLGKQVEVIVAEINNTPWGEQYCYVLDTRQHPTPFKFDKQFHISPLMPMEMNYEWWLNSPDETINISMKNNKNEKTWFSAHLSLKKKPITHKNLRQILLIYPFMTMKVIGAIYWQALRTWLKGADFYPKKS